MNSPTKNSRSIIITGTILVAFILVILGSAIYSKQHPGMITESGESMMAYSYGMKDLAVTGAAPSPSMRMMDQFETAGETAAEVDQKVIKTGELDIIVDGVSGHIQNIVDIATSAGGFVQSSRSSEDPSGNMHGFVTIRVPAERFESIIQEVKALAIHVDSESTNGQDVTEHYTDLTARLSAAEAQEAQYLTILKDASTVGEILAVQEHLSDVRMTIESLEGQIKYLENQTSYSTLTVRLSEETNVSLSANKFDAMREAKGAARYVVFLAQKMLEGLIWIVIVGGAILVPLGIIATIGRAFYRRRRK